MEPILAARVTAPGQRAKLSTILGDGMKAVTIRVNDVLGVAGFVLPGDRVDILLMTGGGQNAYVDVLLQGVKVLAIDQVSNEQADRPIVSRSVTLEVNTEQSQKLVLAANVGTLALTLRNVSSTDIEDFDRVTFKDLNDFDAADDIVEALVQEAVDAQQIDPTVERLESLEELLKNLSVGINQRIDGVEQTIIEQDAVAESENVVVSEPEPVRLPVFVVPEKSTVGVIRNGSRVEYDVLVEGEDDASAGDSAGN